MCYSTIAHHNVDVAVDVRERAGDEASSELGCEVCAGCGGGGAAARRLCRRLGPSTAPLFEQPISMSRRGNEPCPLAKAASMVVGMRMAEVVTRRLLALTAKWWWHVVVDEDCDR